MNALLVLTVLGVSVSELITGGCTGGCTVMVVTEAVDGCVGSALLDTTSESWKVIGVVSVARPEMLAVGFSVLVAAGEQVCPAEGRVLGGP